MATWRVSGATIGVTLLLAGACTEMGPEPLATSTSAVVGPVAAVPAATPAARPSFGTPVPRPTPPPRLAAVEAPTRGPVGAAPVPPAADQPEAGVHRVAAGETVYDIAARYDVDAYALAMANRLSPPFDLVEGQRLTIPRGGPAGGEGAGQAPAPAPAPEALAARSVGAPEGAGKGAESPGQLTAVLRPPSPLPEPPAADGGFLWPIDGRVLSDFGPKGGGRYNDGINIAATAGAPVKAAQAGVVVYAGNELRSFGNMLLIKHANGWTTAYAHNQELLVARGDRVRRGQVIARAGATGGVDQPQLHFEIRKGKTAVDPLQQLGRPSATAAGGRAAG